MTGRMANLLAIAVAMFLTTWLALSPVASNATAVEADIEVVSDGCSLPAGEIDVCEDAALSCEMVVFNGGPFGPVDVQVTEELGVTAGCTVTPSTLTETVVDLSVGEQRRILFFGMTVHCTEPGDQQLDYTSTASIIDPGISDPDLTNNSQGPAPLPFRALAVTVPIDIKPESCPNPINVASAGVLPVAILGTEDFDVTLVDPSSVELEGVSPLRWDWEDVATPYLVNFDGCHDLGPDGRLDLTLKFSVAEVVAALGDVSDGLVLTLMLTGNLMEEYNGTRIIGEDVVVILVKPTTR